jgi:hypothetical protein
MHGEDEKCIQRYSRNGKEHLGRPCVNGRILFKVF